MPAVIWVAEAPHHGEKPTGRLRSACIKDNIEKYTKLSP